MAVSTQRGSGGGASDLRQQGRFTQLFLPDGSERLVMHRFAGTEALSRLFEFQVDALSNEVDYDLGTLLGRAVAVSYRSHQNVERYFNGIVASAEWTGALDDRQSYRLVLRPWFWLLGRKANCKIFKNKTVPAIIQDIFDAAGFNDYKIQVAHAFKAQDYIVQYGETDLAFVCRLMEEWGIYFYFEHSRDKHVMHLIDAASMHPKIDIKPPGPEAGGAVGPRSGASSASAGGSGSALVFRPLDGRDRRKQEHVTAWRAERQVRTGRVELRDFDYLNARKSLKGEDQGSESYQHASLEAYDYRGRWADKDDEGKHLATVRLEAEQALDHRKFAIGDAVSLYPGGYVTLAGHVSDDDDYLVIAARHRFASHEYRSGGGGGDEQPYEGSYEFQPQSRPFRAPLATPRPRIFGPQTAFVTTRKGVAKSEEIDVDKDGRIAVNFHWNRGDASDDCSRDVRVAQLWAGKGWGFQFVPRVGMEVVVEFLDGDPDQPLVTGAVYNSDFGFPYGLPGEKTKSGVKTDSSPGSGKDGYNHLYFEDKANAEEINVRAEKDMVATIRNTETRHIAEAFEGGSTSASRTTTIDVGSDHLTISNGNWKVNVTGNVEIKATQEIVISAGAGASKITMNASGITMKAPTITLNGDGSIKQTAPMIEIN